MPRRMVQLFAALTMTLSPATASGATCRAETGASRVALLELYTSEGCDSCPPANRWSSGRRERGLVTQRVVSLSFHVEYWN